MKEFPWDDEQVVSICEQVISDTGAFKRLGISKTPYRTKQWRKDMDRLGVTYTGRHPKLVWDRDTLAAAVATSDSWSETYRKISGGRYHGSAIRQIRTRCEQYGIDSSHFTHSNNPPGRRKRDKDRLFTNNPEMIKRPARHQLFRGMIESGREVKCEVCGLTEWLGQEIILNIDHVDGDWRNNTLQNLRFMCPNCHSQTDTYCNKKRSTREK